MQASIAKLSGTTTRLMHSTLERFTISIVDIPGPILVDEDQI